MLPSTPLQAVRLRRRSIAHAATGSGPPVFLLHGLAGSSRWWQPQVAGLAQHHTVHLVDLIGFGASSRQPFVLAEASAQLVELMDRLNIDRASFVGHSLGGLVAADMAASRPERVARLILVNSAAMPFTGKRSRHVRNLLRALSQMPLRVVPLAVRDWLRAGPLVILSAGGQILASDLRQRLGRIEAPTLVAWGERDPLIPLDAGLKLARAIPRARLAIIEGAGHNPPWQRPEAMRSLLEVFLTAADPLQAALPEGTREQAAVGGPVDVPAPLTEEMPFATRYFSTASHVIHVRTGRSEPALPAPSILLVHGFVISGRYYEPTLELLAPRYATYALDLPGFGWSSKPRRVLSVPQHADALAELQAALGLERSVVVGNSFGCQVAADFAARYPGRVEALILTGPTFDPRRSLLSHVLGLLADIPLENPRLWLAHLPDYVLAGPRRAVRTLQQAWGDPLEGRLPHITAPTLVIRGSRDPIVSRRWVSEMAELLPRGRALEIEGGPHVVNYSYPDELVALIESFLHELALSEAAPPPRLVEASRRVPLGA
jgi:2-hydroxy-6-oxonona-2,4-dienedioate hydrolase